MRPAGICTQGVRLVKMLRIIEHEGRLTSDQYAVEFGVDYRTWSRDLKALRTALAPFGERVYRHGWNLKIAKERSERNVCMQAKDIKHMKTLAVGQAADLKIDTGTLRVWLNRVNGRVEFERLVDGRWRPADEEEDE